MSARNDTISLQKRLNDNAIAANFDDANTLRRAQITLHRWHELECGDSNEYKSWAIERDEKTNVPYMVEHMHVVARQGGSLYSNSGTYRTRIADKETGAIRRVTEICKALGAHFYVQTDPRGCALYVSAEKLTDQNYSSRGIACAS